MFNTTDLVVFKMGWTRPAMLTSIQLVVLIHFHYYSCSPCFSLLTQYILEKKTKIRNPQLYTIYTVSVPTYQT